MLTDGLLCVLRSLTQQLVSYLVLELVFFVKWFSGDKDFPEWDIVRKESMKFRVKDDSFML